MTFVAAAASVAGPVIGGLLGADASSDALAAQERGAARSDALQRYVFDTQRADYAPFLRTGTRANQRLAYLMGLSPGGGGGGREYFTRDQLRDQRLKQYTRAAPSQAPVNTSMIGHPWSAALPENIDTPQFNYSAFTSPVGWDRDYQVPNTGMTAGQTTSQIDEAGLNAEVERAFAEQERARAAEEAAAAGDPNYGSLLRRFSRGDLGEDVVYQSGLQFGLDEGRKGIERQQQASGRLLSGATLKALSRFGTDYGTTKAEGAYNRYTQDQSNIYNRLAGLSGSGQTAAQQVGGAGQSYAQNVGSTAIGLGNARAASGIAGANAITGGIQGAISNYQGNRLLDTLQRGGYKTPDYGVIPMQPGGGY